MIGRLRGTLIHKQPPFLMIEASGVGYELEASLSTFQTLPEAGTEITLHTHLAVREDAHNLYGFATTEERVLFRSLIKISGIGAKLALLILSGMNTDEFARCVQQGNATALVRLPGIGKKTAERLIIEMRDRIGKLEPGLPPLTNTTKPTTVTATEDAVSALVALGYKLPEASRMVQQLDNEGLSSEDIIRQALKAAVR